jgi:uncharacterized protein
MGAGLFMFLTVKYTHSLDNFHWRFIPFVLLFLMTSSLNEELIFHFGIIGALFNHYPKLTILIISTPLFGLPHYFDYPNGLTGVIMAAVLGYILG